MSPNLAHQSCRHEEQHCLRGGEGTSLRSFWVMKVSSVNEESLITQTSLGGFVGPQAVTEVLVLRAREEECGSTGLWMGALCGTGSDPQGAEAQPPLKEP